jgi:hypothetical protein
MPGMAKPTMFDDMPMMRIPSHENNRSEPMKIIVPR